MKSIQLGETMEIEFTCHMAIRNESICALIREDYQGDPMKYLNGIFKEGNLFGCVNEAFEVTSASVLSDGVAG